MPDKIPTGITRQLLVAAIADLDKGVPHAFGESTGYDVLYQGRRYPPKAVVGLAAARVLGSPLGPHDFKGGLGTRCFAVLVGNGFTIVTKGDTNPFPDEVNDEEPYFEGALSTVRVNRYERDHEAREKSIAYHGAKCSVCGFIFADMYGALGEGFIHVHHLVPLSQIGTTYKVDPIKDLRPICPNCHAMLHKRIPPYSIDELSRLIRKRG